MRISDWSSDVCSSDLRATISRAIRAPNIFEAFRPSEGQTTNVEDPCAETNLGDNPNRAANCAALGRPDGFTPLNGGVGVPFIVSGNENLSPEVSDSWTAGIVLTPNRSEEHTSELQSLMRISYAVFCLKKKKTILRTNKHNIRR